MKDVSVQALAQMEEVGQIMQNVQEAIHFLSQQTALTNKSSEKIQMAGKIFQAVCEDIDQSTAGMDRIMVKAGKLEEVRIATVDIVQSAAAVSEENSASVEEMMASVEDIYHKLGDISEKTKELCTLSGEMERSVDIFSI